MRPEKILDYIECEAEVGDCRFEVLTIEQAEIELFRTVRMGGTALTASWLNDINYASVDWLGAATIYRVIDYSVMDKTVLATRDMTLSAVARFEFPRLNIIHNPHEVHKRDVAFFESESGHTEMMFVSELKTLAPPPKRNRNRKLSAAKPMAWPQLQPGLSIYSDTL